MPLTVPSVVAPLDGVVIGRNEAARLGQCLQSLRSQVRYLVYVDSGSTDGSLQIAYELADRVIELTLDLPYSASRARNNGLGALPSDSEYVLFVDGDCIIDRGFGAAAVAFLSEQEGRAVAMGTLKEAHPEASIYNRACDVEWSSSVGEVTDPKHMLGVFCARRAAVLLVGGYNEQLEAGEDPDFASRLLAGGHTIWRLSIPMGDHDAELLTFAQWWKRSSRTGKASYQKLIFGGRNNLREAVREIGSPLFWTLLLPLALIVSAIYNHIFFWIASSIYVILFVRTRSFVKTRHVDRRDRLLLTVLYILAKPAGTAGIIRSVLSSWRS